MTATQEQLAALAALVGITPKTHRHLYRRARAGEFVAADLLEGLYGNDHDTKPYTIVLPPLDTPAGDDVFGIPLMRWLIEAKEEHGFYTMPDNSRIMSMRFSCGKDGSRFQATLALLRACLAAGVPEIVEIFGRDMDETCPQTRRAKLGAPKHVRNNNS